MKTEQGKATIPESVNELVDWLSSFGQSESGGVNRLLYSKPWIKAQHSLKQKMENHGLNAYFDSVGNLFGRLEGTDPQSPCIVTGSHIDSVVDGGKYDGVYGIIASFIAVQRLQSLYGTPKKSIEVVSLCEEEGSRFPITFWGSGNITGRYDINDAKGIEDQYGISLVEAMKTAGFDPKTYQSPIRTDIDGFVECHIEQGVVLERTNTSLGIVSHIVGQKRFTITVRGESNHAGTTPMPFRKDSIAVSADLIQYITQKAKETEPDLVATVGHLTPVPNVPNVIAGETSFTLDVRHYKKEILDHFCHQIETYGSKLAKQHGMDISFKNWLEAEPVQMDDDLTLLTEQQAKEKGISFSPIVSGAGHDAQMFGSYCPTALLFVPSHNGISHSPIEYTKTQDLENGIEVLTSMLYRLAY